MKQRKSPYLIKDTQQMSTRKNIRKSSNNLLANRYQKERLEYLQGQTNKIRNSIEDIKSRLALQRVNNISERKSVFRKKLKVPDEKKDFRKGLKISRTNSETQLK